MVEHLLVATGRAPNVENLGLEAAKIEYDKMEGIKVWGWWVLIGCGKYRLERGGGPPLYQSAVHCSTALRGKVAPRNLRAPVPWHWSPNHLLHRSHSPFATCSNMFNARFLDCTPRRSSPCAVHPTCSTSHLRYMPPVHTASHLKPTPKTSHKQYSPPRVRSTSYPQRSSPVVLISSSARKHTVVSSKLLSVVQGWLHRYPGRTRLGKDLGFVF